MNILKIKIKKLQVPFYSLQIKIQITLASLTPTKEEVLDFSLYGKIQTIMLTSKRLPFRTMYWASLKTTLHQTPRF